MLWGDKMFDHNNDNKLDWSEEAERNYVLNEIIFGDDDNSEDDYDNDENESDDDF